jgi:hypothetical protein
VDRRREERFDTTLALRLEHGDGVVRNVSASGVYFVTDVEFEEGSPVKFSMDFENARGGSITVNCRARVVRVETQGAQWGVAAVIRRFDFRHPPAKAPGK